MGPGQSFSKDIADGGFSQATDIGDALVEASGQSQTDTATEIGSHLGESDPTNIGYTRMGSDQLRALQRKLAPNLGASVDQFLQAEDRVGFRQTKNGTLNQRKLVEAKFGASRIFRKREREEEINTAVTVMVDISGSMNGWTNPHQSSSPFDCAVATLEALKSSMKSNDIEFDVGIFNGGSMILDPRKGVPSRPSGGTCITTAIQVGANHILQSSKDKKAVILVTDLDVGHEIGAINALVEAYNEVGVKFVGIFIEDSSNLHSKVNFPCAVARSPEGLSETIKDALLQAS